MWFSHKIWNFEFVESLKDSVLASRARAHTHTHTLNVPWYIVSDYLSKSYLLYLTLFPPYKTVYTYTIREGLGHENKLHILWAFKLLKNKTLSHNFCFVKYKN